MRKGLVRNIMAQGRGSTSAATPKKKIPRANTRPKRLKKARLVRILLMALKKIHGLSFKRDGWYGKIPIKNETERSDLP